MACEQTPLFEREDRYIVIKRKHLSEEQATAVDQTLEMYDISQVPLAVVVEGDWPEYESVWRMIERRVRDTVMADNEKLAEARNAYRFQNLAHRLAAALREIADGCDGRINTDSVSALVAKKALDHKEPDPKDWIAALRTEAKTPPADDVVEALEIALLGFNTIQYVTSSEIYHEDMNLNEIGEEALTKIQTSYDKLSAKRPSAKLPADGVPDAITVIDDLIDRYSVAGANLLHWLDADDLEQMPKPTGRPAGLPWNMPTATDWENWASDVACRKFFEALYKAKEAIRTEAKTLPADDVVGAEAFRLLREVGEAIEEALTSYTDGYDERGPICYATVTTEYDDLKDLAPELAEEIMEFLDRFAAAPALSQPAKLPDDVREVLGHEEAIEALVNCSATTTLLSYREAIEGYIKLRGLDTLLKGDAA